MSYDLTGTVKLLQDEQQFNSGFKKRELVVSVQDGNYTQEILIEFHNDKIDLLSSLSPGDEVTVTFDLRGREYNGRYFTNVVGWKVSGGNEQRTQSPAPQNESANLPIIDDDDIPF